MTHWQNVGYHPLIVGSAGGGKMADELFLVDSRRVEARKILESATAPMRRSVESFHETLEEDHEEYLSESLANAVQGSGGWRRFASYGKLVTAPLD